MGRRATRLRAKKLLADVVPHVGHDVIVIGPGTNGEGYLATSMPTCSAEDIDAVLTMAEEAVKKLRAWKRRRETEARRTKRVEMQA